jgi:hypothetical protein
MPKKRMKDLNPGEKAKKVKGGRTTIWTQVGRIQDRLFNRAVPRIGQNVERTTLELGQGIERTLNPR